MTEVLDVDLLCPANPLVASFQPTLVLVWAGDRVLGSAEVAPILPGGAGDAHRTLLSSFADRLLAAAAPASSSAGAASAAQPLARHVSVVVCTRDRPRLLHDCLHTLTRLDPAPAEVIVVDRGASRELSAQVSENVGVRYVPAPGAGPAEARNRGWKEAQGDVVAFVGDDTRAHPAYLRAVAAAFAAPGVGAVTGLVAPGELTTLPQRLFEHLGGLNRGYVRKLYGPAQWHSVLQMDRRGTGANVACRRSVLEALGGFDSQLDVVPVSKRDPRRTGADLFLLAESLRAGWSVVYQPDAVVRRTSPRDWPGLAAEMHDNGAAYAAVLSRYEQQNGDEARELRRERHRWHIRDHVRAPLASMRRRKPWLAALLLAEARGSRRRGGGAIAATTSPEPVE